MSFDPTGKTVDQILDHGAPGLQYWEHFLPLYDKAFGTPAGRTLTELCARYDEQRGMDLAEFDTARTELEKALADAETRWSAQQAVAQTLPGAWTGASGAEALAIVNSQVRRARDDLDAARTAAAAMAAAVDPLRRAVLAKAEVALALLEPTASGEGRIAIDGKTPDVVDALIVAGDDHWLTGTFRPDVDRKLTTFTAACDTAGHTVESQYRTILTALAQVIDHPYPQPGETLLPQPDPATPANYPAPQPLPGSRPTPAMPSTPPIQWSPSTQAQSVPQPVAPPTDSATAEPAAAEPIRVDSQPGQTRSQPAATVPETQPSQAVSTESPAAPLAASTGSTPAATQSDQLATVLKTTLGQLETGLQQGISTALEKLGALGIPSLTATETPGATDNPADPDTPKSDSGHPTPSLPTGKLEFDLAGKHFRLERTPDGTLALAITDESGRTLTYTLSFDPNGNPTLTTDDPSHTPPDNAPAETQPPAPTDSAPGPDPGKPDGQVTDQAAPPEISSPPPANPAPDCPCPPEATSAPNPPPADPGPAAPGSEHVPPVCEVPSESGPPPPLNPTPNNPEQTPSPESSSPPSVAGPSPEDLGQPNPAPAHDEPAPALEIPDGGIEIPEVSPHG